jgi:hypothetical protein
MANISISDLTIAGSNLFADDESYLYELTDVEFASMVYGNGTPLASLIYATAVSAGITLAVVIVEIIM